ncbi:hypothetical protein PRIC1_003730 [Phytophthora ramorum]
MPVRQERKALLASDDKSGAVVVDYGTVPKQPVDAPPPSKPKTFDGDLEDGALRAGPPPELLSPEVLALLMHQWFWLGVPVIGEVPHAVRFIVNNYIVVELIEQGTEGALYGLLTTTNHVAAPFGRTTAKIINAHFHVWKDDILADTYETRRDVTYTIWICYGMKLVSLIFLPLLPNQRNATQALRRQGGVSKRKGMWMIIIIMVALVWLTVVNVLSMDPETECWPITGGCAPDGSVDNPRQVPV